MFKAIFTGFVGTGAALVVIGVMGVIPLAFFSGIIWLVFGQDAAQTTSFVVMCLGVLASIACGISIGVSNYEYQ